MDDRQPLAPLEAYAHPCWSVAEFLPLDSSHERRCLDILIRFQGWMAAQGCHVAITKPLHDRSNYCLGQDAGVVVMPDFESTIHAASGGVLRSFAIEVMGYDRSEYRAMQAQVRAAIRGKRAHHLKYPAHDMARRSTTAPSGPALRNSASEPSARPGTCRRAWYFRSFRSWRQQP